MPANLRPLDGIRGDFAQGWPTGVRRLGEGLALLAPLGVLLPMAGGRPAASRLGSLIRTMTATALVSLAVEMLQTAVPGQVVDVDSLLLNTAGAALAHAAVVPAGRAWLRRRAVRRSGTALLPEEPAQGGPRRFPGSGSPHGATLCPLRLRNVEGERQPVGRPRTVHQGAVMSSLARPTQDRMIGGVCAALARRFGTSASTMRVIFLLSCLLPGPQFLLYIALWILLPSEDKTRAAAW
ncbi:hypothetical protein SHKM778_11980 [Streptomyces sp. KM77-8]|uniref:PspC domain-containing protein n=1 Tax=Streptomyces haneummycinicus TaxID=3074435 RepID=A0AAT9HBX3_9ACTN